MPMHRQTNGDTNRVTVSRKPPQGQALLLLSRTSMVTLCLLQLLLLLQIPTTTWAAFSPTHSNSNSNSKAVAVSVRSLTRPSLSTTTALAATPDKRNLKRVGDIRRKINQLKKEGKLKKNTNNNNSDDDDQLEISKQEANLSEVERIRKERERLRQSTDVADQYAGRIRAKLGDVKGRFYGYLNESDDNDSDSDASASDDAATDNTDTTMSTESDALKPRLGALTAEEREDGGVVIDDNDGDANDPSSKDQQGEFYIDPNLVKEKEPVEDESDEDLVELVARKLEEKRQRKRDEEEAQRKAKVKQLQEQMLQSSTTSATTTTTTTTPPPKTTGVGGAWQKNDNTTTTEDTYRPSRGSWGYFERPKDISKAFGGGRRVGAGYQDELAVTDSDRSRTKQLLQRYREKVGLEVASEKEHADEIEEAVRIGKAAMQRGLYGTAVSALEKVTKYCSSESKVGGNVYLELAMAYEANGRAEEALTVYRRLTERSRVVDVRQNAKKLLYGMEAMDFMRNDAKAAAFQRKEASQTFIDATGLDKFAKNFDDVYMTGYVNRESSFYKKLTQAVVRSPREARQVLLNAVDAGMVSRMKVVQALLSLSRSFDKALKAEQEAQQEPTAFLDGAPIATPRQDTDIDLGGYVLASPQDTIDNLQGEWRLQLLADRSGEGVRYYNRTVSWQSVDTDAMRFRCEGPTGLLTVPQEGQLGFDDDKRILSRQQVQVVDSPIVDLLGLQQDGAASSVVPQQIVTVDSILLVTRCVMDKPQSDEKSFFAVWRRVQEGTYCEGTR